MTRIADITIRRAYYNDSTPGRIFSTHFQFYAASLELPWRGNAPRISCIPEGLYRYRVAPSPALRGRPVIWIDGVEGRSVIQMHPGNYTSQLMGCILPGTGIVDMDGDNIPDVSSSGATLDKILRMVPDKGTIRFTKSQPPFGVYNDTGQI